jgi:hypothetical protein
MKKILFVCIAAFAASVSAFAQGGKESVPNPPSGDRPPARFDRTFGDRPPARPDRPLAAQAEELTINGKLEWVNGQVAVKTGGKTYYVSGLSQFLGFVDGLKEGAQVTLTGRAFVNPQTPEYARFRTEKLTFKGKDYALPEAGAGAPDGRKRGGGSAERPMSN